MIVNVRGALGTQIFEYANGLVQADKRNTNISSVYINTGGNVVDTVKVDWLSQVFKLPCPVQIVSSKSKQDVWRNISYFKDLSTNGKTLQQIKLKHKVKKNNYKILHVRGKDRKVASLNDYIQLAKTIGPTVKFIGDDELFINDIQQATGLGENISRNAIEDWYACIGADEIYFAFTNFTLSAMLFDPAKKISMLSEQSSNGEAKIKSQVYDCVQILFDNYFTNANWL